MKTTGHKTSQDSKVGQLKAILYLLQENITAFKNDVDDSYDLLAIGEKTELAKKLEKQLENPMDSISEIHNGIDSSIKEIINKIVANFFIHHKKLISRVLRSKTSTNDLHYSIVLKEDTTKNRDAIFSFFDQYDLMDQFSKFPVYFQFVPVELVSNIRFIEELDINQ